MQGNRQQLCPAEGGAGRGESRPAGSWKSGQICHRQTIRLCVLPRLPLIKLFALTKEAGRCVLEATSAEVPNGPIGRPVGGWRRSLWPPRWVLLASSGFPPLVSSLATNILLVSRLLSGNFRDKAANLRVDIPGNWESHIPGINPLSVFCHSARGHFTVSCVKKKKKKESFQKASISTQ